MICSVSTLFPVGIPGGGWLLLAGLAAAAFAFLIFREIDAKSVRRLHSAADAYAERELAHDRQVPTREFMASVRLSGTSVRLVSTLRHR